MHNLVFGVSHTKYFSYDIFVNIFEFGTCDFILRMTFCYSAMHIYVENHFPAFTQKSAISFSYTYTRYNNKGWLVWWNHMCQIQICSLKFNTGSRFDGILQNQIMNTNELASSSSQNPFVSDKHMARLCLQCLSSALTVEQPLTAIPLTKHSQAESDQNYHLGRRPPDFQNFLYVI